MNQREIALNILYRTISDNAFTNLLLRKELDRIDPIKKAFISNLIYGVLDNYDLLVFQLKDKYKKTSLRNRIILAMATYEYLFLKKEKYTVVNEYVNLASNYDKGFINATLHKLDIIKYSNNEAINNSLPEWIYNLLKKQYSNDELEKILANYKRIPKVYYHLNTNKATFNDLKNLNIEIVEDNIFISDSNLLSTEEFRNGLFYVQDINANKLISNLDLKKDDIFLDGCCAPGSKLINALKYINDSNAYANDINENRINLVNKRVNLLGYHNVHYYNLDARNLDSIEIKFDKILIDVPCSGLGVIGRKPDIKFHITGNSLDELENIQKDILISASKIIKKGGLILYSTCTLNKKENTRQIQNFLNENSNFRLLKEKTIIEEEGDLFYWALLKRL